MSIRYHLMLLASVVDGEAVVTIAGKFFVLKEGEMIVMPAKRRTP